MADFKILGDMLQLSTSITEEEFRRVERYSPETLKLKDEEGNESFRIGTGAASISNYGIVFSNCDHEGHLFTMVMNPVELHDDREAEKKIIAGKYATVLQRLGTVETAVKAVAEETIKTEEAVMSSITFADEEAIKPETTEENIVTE